ncbi:hypothetical protein MPER_07967, partial [Moniliophthora perniciosa FA553]
AGGGDADSRGIYTISYERVQLDGSKNRGCAVSSEGISIATGANYFINNGLAGLAKGGLDAAMAFLRYAGDLNTLCCLATGSHIEKREGEASVQCIIRRMVSVV